jgi:DNA mismatch endonuclease (patch repair protein)
MSRVKGKDTGLEKAVRTVLHKRGYRFKKHVISLPGKPDIVFTKQKVAVFIDGDFWHGYRLPLWESDLSDFWKRKINGTRERDRKNFHKLRRMGWKVIRIWQHELEKDFDKCIARITAVIDTENT